METKLFYNKTLTTAKKIFLLNKLGGKCSNCGETRHWMLEFHHEGDKQFDISRKNNARISLLEKEVDKCICVCSNCHREIHNTAKITRNSKLKEKMLEYKNTFCCTKCGYSKSNGALDFHHTDPKTKNAEVVLHCNVDSLTCELKEELDKCVVLCANCHREEHYDLEFFVANKEYILNKSRNIKEIHPTLDKEEIKNLYESGIKSSEIAKKFKVTNGAISTILKTFGLTRPRGSLKIDREEFLKFANLGYSRKQLKEHFCIDKSSVLKIIKELDLKIPKTKPGKKEIN